MVKLPASGANCEEVQANMDGFFVELSNNPNSNGYILIYGADRAARRAEGIVKGWIKFRRYDPSRITLLNGGGNNKRAEVELWSVPAGAVTPVPSAQIEAGETAEPEVKTEAYKSPQIYNSYFPLTEIWGHEPCIGPEPRLHIESYALTVKENPKIRGNIVIYETSQKSFRRKEKEILTELMESGIARKRIKTFFMKVTRRNKSQKGGVELWIIP